MRCLAVSALLAAPTALAGQAYSIDPGPDSLEIFDSNIETFTMVGALGTGFDW